MLHIGSLHASGRSDDAAQLSLKPICCEGLAIGPHVLLLCPYLYISAGTRPSIEGMNIYDHRPRIGLRLHAYVVQNRSTARSA